MGSSLAFQVFYFYPRPPRGGRPTWRTSRERSGYFYPRPPRGGRLLQTASFGLSSTFLSTPSARRATSSDGILRFEFDISIHALREEGDGKTEIARTLIVQFLSTPSARRATSRSGGFVPNAYISIHALREEGDKRAGVSTCPLFYFYPRPPRGGRPDNVLDVE